MLHSSLDDLARSKMLGVVYSVYMLHTSVLMMNFTFEEFAFENFMFEDLSYL